MKLHYSKILLLFLPLNILVTSYQAHNNNNEPYVTPHHTQTNRSLCECNTQSSNYDKDTCMKSVMQQFVDRNSQRFEEYKERLKEKRQKRKEQRDKNIQKIIEEDKREKSLAEKVEKGCLRCGCALGGGVLPVWGLICGAGYAGWTNYVATTVAKTAMDAGMNVIKETLKTLGVEKLIPEILKGISSIKDFRNVTQFAGIIQKEFVASCRLSPTSMCTSVINGPKPGPEVEPVVTGALNQIVTKAPQAAQAKAVEVATNYASTTSSLSTAITSSVVALLIIVLLLVIIYFILRYRRKKKMKKKLQYIKLLEE
ncbi:rifin PIR protein,putative [Plasmodium sp. DRC-Itaito]|nr:rifin PIR protein,putative [Plasmodium sp. DRC-Itaito]